MNDIRVKYITHAGTEWTGNVTSFANMFNKRIDPHAQKEVQDLASAIQEVVEPLFPISWKALTRQDLGA